MFISFCSQSTTYSGVRLAADPKFLPPRTEGESGLCYLKFAYNSYPKEKYEVQWVDVTIGGKAADRAARLKKGDTFTVSGEVVEVRKGDKVYKSIPFPTSFTVHTVHTSDPDEDVDLPGIAPPPTVSTRPTVSLGAKRKPPIADDNLDDIFGA